MNDDWMRAVPLEIQKGGFDVRVENGRVRFSLKQHYASEEAARVAVEHRYIPAWKFVVGLERGPNAFELRFGRSEIVDRNPPPGPHTLSAHLRIVDLFQLVRNLFHQRPAPFRHRHASASR